MNNMSLFSLLQQVFKVSTASFITDCQMDFIPPYALAHWARDMVELLRCETADFIPPDLWPPNSLDLNLFNYSVRGILQE